MLFSVITVCFNAGDKLKDTVENILLQSWEDYEIIVKDGGSSDESLSKLPASEKIKVYSEKDGGIYDAMNRAVGYASGDYVIFMNCGDSFYDNDVLKKTAQYMSDNADRKIYYGDAFFCNANQTISQPSEITESICYRHMPNHQSCFFARSLWDEYGFDTKYKIRADYDFFLKSFFEKGIRPAYLGITVASYEGGGYSESKENQKRDREEHREIVVKYMGEKKANHYRRIMRLTLQPLRTWIAHKSIFAGAYDSIKKRIYKSAK
ncbi:MAG: glycosyltransferase [Lachnospiraceae bacterium]|nr:glycosyltransferase [Lachnospiraceae bacterium]